MSAELLRKAATILRERAEAATPGPWRAMDYDPNPEDEGVALLGKADTAMGQHMIGYFHVWTQPQMEANGAYAATMHPGVGLALADWLDELAAGWPWDDEDVNAYDWDGNLLTLAESVDSHAVTLARLIVGEQP